MKKNTILFQLALAASILLSAYGCKKDSPAPTEPPKTTNDVSFTLISKDGTLATAAYVRIYNSKKDKDNGQLPITVGSTGLTGVAKVSLDKSLVTIYYECEKALDCSYSSGTIAPIADQMSVNTNLVSTGTVLLTNTKNVDYYVTLNNVDIYILPKNSSITVNKYPIGTVKFNASALNSTYVGNYTLTSCGTLSIKI